jgi:hypothetical protein
VSLLLSHIIAGSLNGRQRNIRKQRLWYNVMRCWVGLAAGLVASSLEDNSITTDQELFIELSEQSLRLPRL